jgi:Tol biopolymer transport system component
VAPVGSYQNLRLSPDGTKVAFDLTDPDSGLDNIWIQDLNRPARTRLTFGDATSENSPVWSPDGSKIVYAITAKYDDLFVRPAGGGGEEALLHSDQDKVATDWSRDGKFLAYDADDEKGVTHWDLWILPLRGDRKPFAYLSTPFDERSAMFSPDVKWIAYSSNETGRPEIYAAPFPATGAKWQISTAGGFACAWRGDGREIIYLSPDLKVMSVPVEPRGASLSVGNPTYLFTARGSRAGAVPADAKRFLLALPPPQQEEPRIILVSDWTSALKPR